MISSRIKRGAVRTHVLIRNKFETYNTTQVKRSVKTARSLALSFVAVRMVFLTVPISPVSAAGVDTLDIEPPSTIPVYGVQTEEIIDGVTIDMANYSQSSLVPFTYSASSLSTVEVGKSYAAAQDEESKLAEEKRIAEQKAKQAKAKVKTVAATVAAPAPVAFSGDVTEYVRQQTIATFGEAEWNAMYQIVKHESGFNPNAVNKKSGACGLFQANPCSKMGGTALENQVRWGMNYIRARYGTPSKAWAFWTAHRWY